MFRDKVVSKQINPIVTETTHHFCLIIDGIINFFSDCWCAITNFQTFQSWIHILFTMCPGENEAKRGLLSMHCSILCLVLISNSLMKNTQYLCEIVIYPYQFCFLSGLLMHSLLSWSSWQKTFLKKLSSMASIANDTANKQPS